MDQVEPPWNSLFILMNYTRKKIYLKAFINFFIDTTTETGKFVFKLFALLAEHELNRLIRRTKARQEAARVRGRVGGRPKGLSARNQEIAPLVINAYKDQRNIREIMKAFEIPSTTTVYKILKENDVPHQAFISTKK
jgi:DNA invertase Pin-like site-specific DNA recombinase